MNSWRPYPLVRLVFPFAAGIAAEVMAGSSCIPVTWLPVFPGAVLVASLILPSVVSTYRLRWANGLLFNIFLFLAGYGIAGCRRPSNDPGYLGNDAAGLFIAAIIEPPALNATGARAMAEVRFHRVHGRWEVACGGALLYLKSKPGHPPLQYGDHVLIHAAFDEITDNSNPHGFNYARYLRQKGISHRAFAESYAWQPIHLKSTVMVRQLAFRVRDRLLGILRDNHVEGREFAVAAALLLGYVNDLDAGLRNDYAATGAMHILSVSGMHVGIIYIFLEFLLGALNKNRTGRALKAFLLLAFIWFYAMITGLSPCVLRSAAMLSLPIIGKSMNRSPDMYNIIAASMILILASDPFLLPDVGFQLSYLAVTGIVVLYRPVYDLYVTSAWIPDKIWSILAVSIAAQVATLPITLYTFHQFPNYFMLTNLFVVPLSSLIIYTGILTLAAGPFPAIAALCAKLLVFLVWLMNSIIHFIEQLPWSVIRGIFISAPEMMLLYLAIAALFLFLTLRRIPYLYLVLIAAILLNFLFLGFKVNRLGSSRLIIFNTPREALYMFTCQDRAVVLYEPRPGSGGMLQKQNHEAAHAEMDAGGIRYHRDLMITSRRRPVDIARSFVPLGVAGDFIRFSGYRIALLRGPVPKGLKKQLEVDLLVVTGNPKVSLADAIRTFHPAQIVIDATCSRYRTVQWLREAAVSGVHCHAVTVHGVFQKEF